MTVLDSDSRAETIALAEGLTVSRGALTDAFDLVAPKDNWKKRISIVVTLTDIQLFLVRQAVPFFTGSEATVISLGNYRYHVIAAGYYATCGA